MHKTWCIQSQLRTTKAVVQSESATAIAVALSSLGPNPNYNDNTLNSVLRFCSCSSSVHCSHLQSEVGMVSP